MPAKIEASGQVGCLSIFLGNRGHIEGVSQGPSAQKKTMIIF